MPQHSVYARRRPSEENMLVYEGGIRANFPPVGEVRILFLTDRQFGRMKVFHRKKRGKQRAPRSKSLFFERSGEPCPLDIP